MRARTFVWMALALTPLFRVTFETGRAELTGTAEQTLQGVVKLLMDNATYTADVIGYTDDVGAAGSNVNLSWRREEMVRRFMVGKGIALNRFSFIGLGEDRAKGRARQLGRQTGTSASWCFVRRIDGPATRRGRRDRFAPWVAYVARARRTIATV